MANSNRFADAIKRIVEPLFEERDGNSPSPNEKTPINGVRGIGYLANGAVAGAKGTPAVTTAPDSTNVLTKDASDAAENAAANAALNALGATGDEGSYDAEDLLDKTDTPLQPGSGIDEAVQGALNAANELNPYGSSALKELTGLKYGSTDIRIRTDGQYRPPVGWSDSNTPPLDPTYQAGYVWFGAYYGGLWGLVPYDVASRLPPLYDGTRPSFAPHHLVNVVQVNSTLYQGYIQDSSPNPPFPVDINRVACPGIGSEAAVLCTLSQPTQSTWPPLGYAQITRNDQGLWVTNQYDTLVPLIFKTPRSTIKLKTTGGDDVQLSALVNGGFALYRVDGSNNPTGDIGIFDKQGFFQGYTDTAGLLRVSPQ